MCVQFYLIQYGTKIRDDLETKIATLEHIYNHEEATPRTLEAIVARKNKLNTGWTKQSLAVLETGKKAKEEATQSLTDIEAKMTDFRDVVTVSAGWRCLCIIVELSKRSVCK